MFNTEIRKMKITNRINKLGNKPVENEKLIKALKRELRNLTK